MKNYVILECDNFLHDLLDIIRARGDRLKKIICQNPNIVRLGSDDLSIPVDSWDDFIPEPNDAYLCGLMGGEAETLHQKLREEIGISLESLIHPNALVSPTAKIASGSTISAGAILASNVAIGEGCFIGQGAIFGHDTVLENYVVIRSGAKLAGHIRVEEGAMIGMRATIIEDVSIGKYARVEPGAVVLKDVPSRAVVSGIPAAIIVDIFLNKI